MASGDLGHILIVKIGSCFKYVYEWHVNALVSVKCECVNLLW